MRKRLSVGKNVIEIFLGQDALFQNAIRMETTRKNNATVQLAVLAGVWTRMAMK